MSINWDAIAATGGAVGVIVSLGALAIQVRSLRRSLQSATYQNILQAFIGFTDVLLRYPQLEPVLLRSGDLDQLAKEDQVRAEMALTILFNWYESLVLQCDLYHAVPKAVDDHWMAVLREDLLQPAIRHYWHQTCHYYHPLLQARVATELSRIVPATDPGAKGSTPQQSEEEVH